MSVGIAIQQTQVCLPAAVVLAFKEREWLFFFFPSSERRQIKIANVSTFRETYLAAAEVEALACFRVGLFCALGRIGTHWDTAESKEKKEHVDVEKS